MVCEHPEEVGLLHNQVGCGVHLASACAAAGDSSAAQRIFVELDEAARVRPHYEVLQGLRLVAASWLAETFEALGADDLAQQYAELGKLAEPPHLGEDGA